MDDNIGTAENST